MAENRDVSIINMTVETDGYNSGRGLERNFNWKPLAALGTAALVSAAIYIGADYKNETTVVANADFISPNDCGAAHLLTDYEPGDLIIPTVSRFNPLCFPFARTIRPEIS